MLTAAECLEIIENAYPDLWVYTYSFDNKGQNNDVLIVNEEIVFRFPRTARAAERLGIEAAVLGRLQDRVTLPIPNPLYLSLPGDRKSSTAQAGARPGAAVGAERRNVLGGRMSVPGNGRHGGVEAIPGRRSVPAATLPVRVSFPVVTHGPRVGRRPVPREVPPPGQLGPDGKRPWERGLGGSLPWERDKAGRGRRGAGGKPSGSGSRSSASAGRPSGKSKGKQETALPPGARPAPRGVFVGYRWIPGEPLRRDTILAVDDERVLQVWAEQLAGFLVEVHGTPMTGALASLLPPYDGRARWVNFYERVRAKLFPLMRAEARRAVERRFESYLGDRASFDFAMTLVHGDFGPSNILMDQEAGRLTGVIDFGSTGLEDPAVDLAALMGPYGFGEAFLRRFEKIYPITPGMLERARFYADTFPLQDAVFGIENGDEEAFNWGMAPYR